MGSFSGLTQWDKDSELPQAAAQVTDSAPIRSLTQELPYATSVALKRKKKKSGIIYVGKESEREWTCGSSRCGAVETYPTNIHEDADLIPSLAQWAKDPALQ